MSAFAQAVASSAPPPPTADNVADLPAVVVSGVQPGPGLWKVSKGDHVMWVLGTLSPLPRAMQWQSRDLDQIISQSQQVLLQPSIKLKANVGWLGKLFLLPSAYSARKNDNGETLQQVLPAPLYARWLVLKQKYIGTDKSIERWRPLFAAQDLYKKAIKAHGLSNSGGVPGTVDALAQKYGIAETPVNYQVVIDNPRAAIKAFKRDGPADIQCFNRTLDSIEQDMPAMTARANAWATGDLETLRQLPDSNRRNACVAALTHAGFAQTLGVSDVLAKQKAIWLSAARTALTKNTQTFALLPMDELLKADGYLATLQAEGYQVEAPQE
ncbi:MAG: TraB/GumN family protein [Rhodanobacter sp.]